MSAIFLLIGASLVVAIGFLIAFIWSVKDGQYDDDYTPSIRMLFETSVVAKQKDTASSPTIEISKPKKNKSRKKK